MDDELVAWTANDYVRLMLRRWYVVLVPIVLAVAAAAALDARAADSYSASATVSVRTGLLSSPVALLSDGDLLGSNAVASEIETIRGPAVKERAEAGNAVLGSLPSPDVSQVGRTHLVSIQISASDSDRAAAVANAYAAAYLEHSRESLDDLMAELEARADGLGSADPSAEDDPLADLDGLRRGAVAAFLADLDLVAADDDVAQGLVELAEAPSSPVARDTKSKLAAAAIVGLLAGLTLLFVIEMLHRGRVASELSGPTDQHG